MARYIDADELYETVTKKYSDIVAGCYPYNIVAYDMARLVKEAPTADVVPKSEVEKLSIELLHAKEDYGDLVAEFIGAGKKIEKLEKELADMLVSEFTDVSVSMERLYRIRTEHPIYKAIKDKVAREIFEEIENEINNEIKNNYKVLPQVEISNVLWNRISGRINAFQSISEFIAELKKKYTEGET